MAYIFVSISVGVDCGCSS